MTRPTFDQPTTLNVETIDLAALASRLAECVPPSARAGAVVGRTTFRDAVIMLLGCSELEAEQLVDTLVARRFLVLDSKDLPSWRVRPSAG